MAMRYFRFPLLSWHETTIEHQRDWLPWSLLCEPCFKVENLVGVYFLFHEGRVVYVGQSVDVLSRLLLHHRDEQKVFDLAMYLRCPKYQLNGIEAWFIWILRPKYNWTKKSRLNLPTAEISPTDRRWAIAALGYDPKEGSDD